MNIQYTDKHEIGDFITDTHNGITVQGTLVRIEIIYDGVTTRVFKVLDNGVKIEVSYIDALKAN